MAKPPYIELGHGRDAERIPILYEDRSVMAIDKPRGWMLVPFTWQRTSRNLQAAIQSSIGAGAFWARCRQIRFLRYVHRLDADTTGILLFARSPGAVNSLGDLFESRRMEKRYLAVAVGQPKAEEWTCRLSLGKDPQDVSRMCVDAREGKEAETHFRVLAQKGDRVLIEARPYTGRTHQIRVHLTESGLPILGDELYGVRCEVPLALRAVELRYTDPFSRRPIRVRAPVGGFLADYGFEEPAASGTTGDAAPGNLPDRSNSISKRLRQTPPP